MTEPRAYTLDAARIEGALCVRITRSGPDQPTRIALGRPFAEAGRWPGLLFPVCPIAQTAAALAAVEDAAGVPLAPGQAAARDLLVRAEAVAGAVWRAGLTWAPRLGRAPDPAPVRRARAALEALSSALFAGDWKVPGGAALKLDRPGITAATAELRAALEAAAEVSAAAIGAASRFTVGEATDVAPLGADIANPDITPGPVAREETPRARAGDAPRTLGDWLAASDAAAQGHLAALEGAADTLGDHAPTPLPPAATGCGLGIIETARGRLRHVIRLDAGRIALWRVDAPTDWNFAPGGPVEAWARALDAPEDAEAALGWLLVAFDPCAAARIAFETADA